MMYRHAVIVVLAALITSGQVAAADRPESVKKINAVVAAIDKQIEANELSFLQVEYKTKEPTEGVPPSFKFFYAEDGKLVSCEVHVGHETWAKVFNYYFDASEMPLKYKETVIGREDKPAPGAIIYGGKGHILWKNMEETRVVPKDIVDIYHSITKRLDAFAPY